MNPRLHPGLRATGPRLRTQSDERLATMAANGSDAAFEAIVARYRRTLVRHCAGIVGDADAEEAVQDALVRAHGALRRDGSEVRDLGAWLHVIARNAALNVLRSRASRPGPAPLGCEPIDVSARRPAEEREQLGELVAAIRALPERQRDAIVMHELEGRTLDEIASSLGTSNGAVRQLLHRARAAMRIRLGTLAGLGPLVRLVSDGGGAALGRLGALSGCAATAKLCALALLPAAIAPGAGTGSGTLAAPRTHHAALTRPAAVPGSPASTASTAGASSAPALRGIRSLRIRSGGQISAAPTPSAGARRPALGNAGGGSPAGAHGAGSLPAPASPTGAPQTPGAPASPAGFPSAPGSGPEPGPGSGETSGRGSAGRHFGADQHAAPGPSAAQSAAGDAGPGWGSGQTSGAPGPAQPPAGGARGGARQR